MAGWTYPVAERRRRDSAAAVFTLGLHAAVIALLLAARNSLEIPPTPIHVAVIGDLPSQREVVEVVRKSQLQMPTLHVPQPDIAVTNDAPADAAPVVAAVSISFQSDAAAQADATATAPVTQPIFDADYLNNPAPSYPPLAKRLREEGIVHVRVLVSSAGLPDQIELKRSSGSPRLDEAALRVVKKWRFVPARRGGQTVAAWVVIPIAFSLTA